MKMPFGKYKDREIHETPRHYLRWALDRTFHKKKPVFALNTLL